MIKKYLGLIGFLVAFIGIAIAAIYKSYNVDLYPLFEISLLFWMSTSTIAQEINKTEPKNWYIYSISIVSIILIFILLYL